MKQEIKEGAAPVLGGELVGDVCTLRDYFAAKAMQAWIGAIGQHEGHGWNARDFADEAYKAADAMLKARAEGKGA